MAQTIEEIILKYSADLKELKADFAELKGQMNKTEKQSDKVSKSVTKQWKKLGTAIAGVFATKKIVDFGIEVTNLAAQAEGVKRAFKDTFTDVDLNKLRKSVQGTVSDLELMRQAVRARNFKIPIETLTKGFAFATKRAAETGESVDFLVESIINGIGRKSPLILDNLGISASELQAEFKRTGDFAGAVGNIIEKEMGGAGETILTTAQKQAQLNASFENLKVEIGENLLPALNTLLPVVSDITAAVGQLFKFGGIVSKESQEELQSSAIASAESFFKRWDMMTDEQGKTIVEKRESLNALILKKQKQADDTSLSARQRFFDQATVDALVALGRRAGILLSAEKEVTRLTEEELKERKKLRKQILDDEVEALQEEAEEIDNIGGGAFESFFAANDEGLEKFTENLQKSLDKMREIATDEDAQKFFDDLERLRAKQDEGVDVFQQLFGFGGDEIKKAFRELSEEEIDEFLTRQDEIKDRFETIAKSVQLAGGFISDVFALAGAEGERFAKFQKALALFEIGANIAQAIAAGTAAAQTAKPFPANLVAIVSTIAAVTAQAVKAKQLLASAGEPPKYHSGGTVLGRPGQEVPAILQAGEEVISAKKARKHFDLLKAIQSDRVDKYIQDAYDDQLLRNTISAGHKKALKNTNRIVNELRRGRRRKAANW